MSFEEIKNQALKEWKDFESEGRPRILIGAATCGRAAGALEIEAAFREELAKHNLAGSVQMYEVGCHGLCFAEPLVEVKDSSGPRVLYRGVQLRTVPNIVESHLLKGEPRVNRALAVMGGGEVEGLPRFEDHEVLRHQVRIVLRNCGFIDPSNVEHYIARGGYSGFIRSLTMDPQAVIEEISASGLRGRGGAGFPTGTKWSFARRSQADEKYVICNADEGDPGAFMDRSVLEGDPHAVLEGMLIAGYAIGANHGYVYCRAEYPLAIQRLKLAITQMTEKGFLGENIMGSGFNFEIKIKMGAGAFVCGEETALMASIEGHRGMPRSKPPFPANAGLFGKPTNINNVETLASVSAIMERGAEWYAGYGTDKSKGTKTFALAGKIRRTGLIEVPMGTPLSTIIFDIGGGILKNKKFKAVQTGGPSGGCIPAEHLNLPVDYEHLAEVGSIMGSGGMIVIDEDSCMVDVAKYFLSFTESESCGKCTPCRMGTQHLHNILTEITAGRGEPGMIDKMLNIADTMKKASLCGLGQTAPNPVISTLRYFRDEYESHIYDKQCPSTVCQELFRAPCQNACPIEMDVPSYVALIRAGRLEDAYRILKRTNPFPSVCGRVCGHYCEYKCRRAQEDDPLAIRALKRYITDNAKPPKTRKVPVTRKEKIAVVGAGPSGLSCAYELRRRGYHVVVFEATNKPGGMMRWAIPNYRLPRRILKREIEEILETGVELRINTRVGQDISLDELDAQFDHIYLGIGTQKSYPLEIPGSDARGVFGAIGFLKAVDQDAEKDVGKKIAIIGGGNSAVDSARTAMRLGVDSVTIVYRREEKDMPAVPEEVEACKAEGIKFEFLAAPTRVIVEDGRVKGLELIRMDLSSLTDRSARRRPVPREGSEYVIDVDTVISAIGQNPDLEIGPGRQRLGVEIKNNRIAVGKDQRTPSAKVWAGGDVVTGPALVIDAIQAGRDAAMAIDSAIRETNGEGPWLMPEHEKIDIPYMPAVGDMNRIPVPEENVEHRLLDFREVERVYSREQAMAEASRCLRCDYRAEQNCPEACKERS